MRFDNATVLEAIFALKQNFAEGICPARKIFGGVEITPFRHNARAAVSISADFEMAWAWRGEGLELARQKAMIERQNIAPILALLEEFAIPITWATVGHLFLDECASGPSGVGHPDMPRPTKYAWEGDWYVHDPCSNVKKDPLWYAPDLIQQILDDRIGHEIGTHSFSHINFSRQSSTEELVRRELEKCAEVMAPFGLIPRSLVFPHNVMEYSHLATLAACGLTAVRHRDERVRLSYPERTASGVYRIYESMNLRVAKYYDYAQKAKIFIDRATERHAAYSIWFHPSDPISVFNNQFRAILRLIDAERRNGRLWVATMHDIAAYCEAREQLSLHVEREGNAITITFHSGLDTRRYGIPDVSLLISVPSSPKDGWFQSPTGERVVLSPPVISTGRTYQILVTVPTNTTRIQFSF